MYGQLTSTPSDFSSVSLARQSVSVSVCVAIDDVNNPAAEKMLF